MSVFRITQKKKERGKRPNQMMYSKYIYIEKYQQIYFYYDCIFWLL